MKFIHRLGYYLGGFAIGLVILAFFLSGKKTSCAYGPDARVLKNIRLKERAYSEEAKAQMERLQIDTASITGVLRKGDIDFSRSNTDLDSCKTYMVTGNSVSGELEMLFENCDSTATLQKIWRK
ncbi:DUF4258 domain-containing protein [Salinimicrobium sediminilitoris]|uniref:DUF4258 domain-containing protein n=1 Tax=Salinimicrobium sediminilitoris TaxID=2876715 RepID=UPI001E392F1C|nr:DUF4258 domain-containing protein [Salinimicrobium sediminilitoris]MCC8360244.1 DUF4258 domain-containing protein [Salinimicrobium sediminilitoris]